MISNKAGALVLLISFSAMIALAIVGAFVGDAWSHPVAGTLIGGLIGYAAPCLVAHSLRKRTHRATGKAQANSAATPGFWLLLAATATNHWVTNSNRELVQSLRGVTVVGLFGLICGTLAVWGILSADPLLLLHGATAGALLCGLLSMWFEFSS